MYGAAEFLLSIPAHIGIHCYTLAGWTCEETIRQTGESLHAELGRLWVEVEASKAGWLALENRHRCAPIAQFRGDSCSSCHD